MGLYAPTPKTVEPSKWTRWLDWLWPDLCLNCQKQSTDTAIGLCTVCSQLLRPRDSSHCRLCGVRLKAVSTSLCGSCRTHPPPWQGLHWLYLYQTPLTAVIRGLKFRRLYYLARPLGEMLGAQLRSEAIEVDWVTSIPLPWTRKFWRGLDIAHEIALGVCRAGGYAYRPVLTRPLYATPQKIKSRSQRLRQARKNPVSRCVIGRRILLIDDLMTSGGTLATHSRSLLKSGAESVTVAVIGRTPRWFEGYDPKPRRS